MLCDNQESVDDAAENNHVELLSENQEPVDDDAENNRDDLLQQNQKSIEVVNNIVAQIEQNLPSDSSFNEVVTQFNVPNVTNYVEVETESIEQASEYETRIKGLVESNQSKINRIKQLVAEKSGLLKDIDTLNNINRSMAEAIDAFRADDDNATQFQNRIVQLESEINSLRHRIDEANRDRFDLIAENERMKNILATYSEKMLKEHNYFK